MLLASARAKGVVVRSLSRWPRTLGRALLAYLAVTIAVQLVGFALILVARVSAGDPRSDDGAGVANLRVVDDTVWAGAQPGPAAYRELARRGVTHVVDLRTGADDDERHDDPDRLRALGMDYTWVPVPDGHAPRAADVRTFLEVVGRSDGIVFVHCGGGVGRSSVMQAAYLAAAGTDPRFLEVAAVGPMTLEQLWVVATSGADDPGASNPVIRRVSEVLDAPRRALSRMRALF